MFLVDARHTWDPQEFVCKMSLPRGVPINRATRFENKVGSLDVVAGESLIKEQILERFFIDLVAGESLIKERAAAGFNDLVGSIDVVAGEPLLLLPRRFDKTELGWNSNKIWRTNTQVKGFIIEKVKGGYSGAIAADWHYRIRISSSHSLCEPYQLLYIFQFTYERSGLKGLFERLILGIIPL
ncbi:hypothetical protein NE237_014187 [Protea cynaroides]|uniref:Uncharacterized protein n=1 Tax=Protea cynaroides TaxID=273540 RepID=A0A9Q0GMH8_9MAGN|nr:hypothetical protein NE237_014187 [Protea cynaroides]